VILQGTGHDLGGRRGVAVHQDDDRVIIAAAAVASDVGFSGEDRPRCDTIV
jgi:hypothetical protein